MVYATVSGAVWLACTLSVINAQVRYSALEKLGPAVNTSDYDETSPAVSADGKTLYFTRTGSPDFERTLIYNGTDISKTTAEEEYKSMLTGIYEQIGADDIRDPYTSLFNQDIWVAHSIDSAFDFVSHPAFPVNNALPNSVVSTALDSHGIVVINQFYKDGSMYEGFSRIQVSPLGSYGAPKPLHIYDFYNLSDDVNLAFSPGGSVMILSAERKDSEGQNDLYVSFRLLEDLWSTPQNIGPVINTAANESSPFITLDGRRLYFSSNRPGSLGGSDIWVTERLDFTWLKWSAPQKLGAPVNSTSDDSEAHIDWEGEYLYFTSRRDGSSDIYRVPLQPMPRLDHPIHIRGKIVDAETRKPLHAELYYGPGGVEDYLEYFRTFSGLFEFTLSEYDVYKFLAVKPGYKVGTLHFDPRIIHDSIQAYYDVTIELEAEDSWVPTDSYSNPKRETQLRFAQLNVGETISFYNIYFARAQANILPESSNALEELLAAMKTNPSLMLQIEGHTDNVGNELDLIELSWRRAEAVKAFLVEQGISDVRISTIGLGPRKPLTDNSTEEKRRKNRRVEIRIISK